MGIKENKRRPNMQLKCHHGNKDAYNGIFAFDIYPGFVKDGEMDGEENE